MSSLSFVQSCLWAVTRCVPLVQQKLLTFIRAHEFTQPCFILSLNSDTMCAPSSNLVFEQLKFLTFIRAHVFTQPCSILSLNSDEMCALSAAETSYLYQSITAHEFTSLVQSCLWTVTRWVPLVQQKLLTFIRAHEFTQPCPILSLKWHDVCP